MRQQRFKWKGPVEIKCGRRHDLIRLYHGTVSDFTMILCHGLDPERAPTWVTSRREAAENAIGPSRILSPSQKRDSGVIESVVLKSGFEALVDAGHISGTRTWQGFGGGYQFPENVLRNAEAIKLFNRGIVRR
jgi:hypothetical protein